MKIAVVFMSLFLGVALNVSAEVVVHDHIAVKGKPMMLEADTKGRFFSRGGELVEFFVNGKSLGKVLSGGDGRAFKEFTPEKAGLLEIEVKAKDDSDKGFILSLKRGGEIVFIDAQGSLFEGPFSKAPRQGSREAVEEISKRYPVVYLQTAFPGSLVREWLESNGFPSAPILEWRSGRVFRETVGKDLRIKAVIGSDEVLESAKDYTEGLFGFERAGTRVKNWKEIEDSIK